VHEAIADRELAGLVDPLWNEAATTLDAKAVDIPVYRAALRRRFGNSALPHALIQIAADGSQKLPPRILAPMAERARTGLASPALTSVLKGWSQALATVDGLADPMVDQLRTIARRPGSTVRDLIEMIAPTTAPLVASQIDGPL